MEPRPKIADCRSRPNGSSGVHVLPSGLL